MTLEFNYNFALIYCFNFLSKINILFPSGSLFIISQRVEKVQNKSTTMRCARLKKVRPPGPAVETVPHL